MESRSRASIALAAARAGSLGGAAPREDLGAEPGERPAQAFIGDAFGALAPFLARLRVGDRRLRPRRLLRHAPLADHELVSAAPAEIGVHTFEDDRGEMLDLEAEG